MILRVDGAALLRRAAPSTRSGSLALSRADPSRC